MKFEAINAVVVYFYSKFLLDNFDFSTDFSIDFLSFAWSKLLSNSKC